MNAENRGVAGDVLILQSMHPSVLNVIVGYLRDSRGACHSRDEEQRRQDHPGLDGHRQIRKHGQPKRYQPHADVSPGQSQQLRNLTPLTHVVRHDNENSS